MASAVAMQALSSDGRAAERFRLLLATSAEIGEAALVPVTIRDVSTTGLLIESDVALAVGATLALDLAGAEPVDATVQWRSGAYAGAQFAAPITEAMVRAVWARSSVVWPQFTASPRAT